MHCCTLHFHEVRRELGEVLHNFLVLGRTAYLTKASLLQKTNVETDCEKKQTKKTDQQDQPGNISP